jgi:hypothetical protein
MDQETEGRFEGLVLNLGMVLGGLHDREARGRLVDSLRSGRLYRGYIERLRDLLTEILNDSAP